MKLGALLCRATQDELVIVKSFDKTRPLEEEMATHCSLPREAHGQYENIKRYDTGRAAPQVGICAISYWGGVKSND